MLDLARLYVSSMAHLVDFHPFILIVAAIFTICAPKFNIQRLRFAVYYSAAIILSNLLCFIILVCRTSDSSNPFHNQFQNNVVNATIAVWSGQIFQHLFCYWLILFIFHIVFVYLCKIARSAVCSNENINENHLH